MVDIASTAEFENPTKRYRITNVRQGSGKKDTLILPLSVGQNHAFQSHVLLRYLIEIAAMVNSVIREWYLSFLQLLGALISLLCRNFPFSLIC